MSKQRYERPIIKKLNTGIMNKFGFKTEFRPVTEIDNVPVKDLIKQYGSPLYVMSEKHLRDTYKKATRAFKTRYPKVQFAWSYKTNYINAVCNVFHTEGSWGEVVSRFEYEKALGNGVPGNKIIFNGPDKTEDDLTRAMKNNSFIHIDHLDELYTAIELAEKLEIKPKVAIRINMDTGVYPVWDRFGFNYENGQAWDAIVKIVSSGKLDLTGLHSHIGTFMLTPEAYGVAASKLSALALKVKKELEINIQYLDLGGGFASSNTLKGSYYQGKDISPAFDDYAEQISTAILNAGFSPKDLPLLILETGRALVDESGYLLGTVIANKRLSDGRRATILDIGVNLLFTAFWYNHKITPAQEFSHYTEDTVLYGPLCMNIDVVRESCSLPPMQKGDNIVIHTVGAYNMTQWMQFIALRPNVVMIDTNGKPHVIRKNEKLEYLQELEQVPEHLKKFKL